MMADNEKTMTYEEQERQGIIKGNPYRNFVPPTPAAPIVRRMSEAETAALQGLTQGAIQSSQPILPLAPQATHSGHLKETFDIRATAKVAERFILWDMAIFGVVTLALAVLIWYQVGGDLTTYSLGWLVVWGAISYFAMNKNRAQAYNHSPTGVARLEQRSQVAMHDRTAQVQEYQIDADKDVRLAEIQVRRELGQAYLRHLEGPKQ